MLYLLASPDTLRSAEALAAYFERIVETLDAAGEAAVGDAVRQGIADNFAAQRAGGGAAWAALAPITVRERKALGYGGERPILVRSGDYRAGLAVASDRNHEATVYASPSMGGWFWQIGSRDRRFAWHEGGTPRMPARPAAVLSDQAGVRVGEAIDLILKRLEPE